MGVITGITAIYKLMLNAASNISRCELINNTIFLEIIIFFNPSRNNVLSDAHYLFYFELSPNKTVVNYTVINLKLGYFNSK